MVHRFADTASFGCATRTMMSDFVPPSMAFPVTDLKLAQLLEGAEAAANVAFVEARAALHPDVGAVHAFIGGVAAMYDGPRSPLTQTFGLGMFGPPTASDLELIEAFFLSRGAPVYHEVSQLAAPETVPQLNARGYRPEERSTVLVRPTSAVPRAGTSIMVREIHAGDSDVWSQVAGEGWSSESAELAAFVENFGRVITRAAGVHCFLAELDGRPIAAATLSLAGDMALLAGASTIPVARKQGAQLALLAARLDFAAQRGVDLAMMVAVPGSASQRNAERQGFRSAYTRTKWRLQGRVTGGRAMTPPVVQPR